MDAHYLEWLNLALRWVHFIIGVAWIGASFYFNWLENNLNRLTKNRDELAGHLWAVHGGGFYYLEKYKVAPKALPEELHWFKWEAYFTWVTGVLLLVVVYYLHPRTYLVDPVSPAVGDVAAVAIGAGSLLVGWVVYDLLCKSPLGGTGPAFFAVGYGLVVLLAWGFSAIYTGRGAYMHVGAVIGTIMAGNVFMVIIPSQKELVRAASVGEAPNGALGKKALLRSRHNNYLTLPVLFVMVSNHFPSTYGSPHGWAVLSGLVLVGIAVRHYFNIRKKSPRGVLLLPAAAAGLVLLAFLTRPVRAALDTSGPAPAFADVATIVSRRCATCHSATPSDTLFTSAPNGVVLDTPEQIRSLAARIGVRAVEQRTMPLGNMTQMTEEERGVLGRWIAAGANVP